jgi:hypothetical protein
MTIAETMERWASEPYGYVFIEGRGWLNVQSMALSYWASEQRTDPKQFDQWEASALRFIEAVGEADRWTLDLETTAMFDEAITPQQAFQQSLREQFDQDRDALRRKRA